MFENWRGSPLTEWNFIYAAFKAAAFGIWRLVSRTLFSNFDIISLADGIMQAAKVLSDMLNAQL